MREAAIEKYLREEVEAMGGICEKHVSPGRRGVPDRLVTLPFLPMFLIETKSPRGSLRAEQVRDHVRRSRLGHTVYVCHTKEEVDKLLRVMKRSIDAVLTEREARKRLLN